jgi:hypothetical protein
VDDDLGIRVRLKNRTLLNKPLPDVMGVGEVPVVGDGQIPLGVPNHDGLGVGQVSSSGGGVADVAQGRLPWKRLQDIGIEHFGDQPQASMKLGLSIVDGADPRGFLPPMLEGIEGQESFLGGFLHSRDTDDTTLVFRRFVEEVGGEGYDLS